MPMPLPIAPSETLPTEAPRLTSAAAATATGAGLGSGLGLIGGDFVAAAWAR
jgi:hypothetical protein